MTKFMYGDTTTAKDRLKKRDNKARSKAIYAAIEKKRGEITKYKNEKKLSGNELFK